MSTMTLVGSAPSGRAEVDGLTDATRQRSAPQHLRSNLRASRRRSDLRARRARVGTLVTAAGLTLLAALLRLIEITSAYDLFIDEATYAAIARDGSLVTGPLLHDLPFVLHPPLGLLLLAIPADVLGIQDVATLVAGLRPTVALVGALTVGVLYLTLHRAGLRKAAVVAALLVALDPFIISFDSRVMLEAFAQLFAVLTVAAVIRLSTASRGGRGRWVILTALAGAATFGTKETFGLVVLLTLLLVAVTAPCGERRLPLLGAGGMLVGYGAVNAVMVSWSGFDVWWQLRTDGLSRLLGLQHPTGFKAEGVQHSFVDRLLASGPELAATYAILAIGGMSALGLLWAVRRHRSQVSLLPAAGPATVRIISLWAVSACAYVAYAVMFGSLEEQMFYIAAAPCAAALTVLVFLIDRVALRRVAISGLLLLLLAQSVTWVQVHTARADVYAQLLDQIDDVAPDDSVIAVTEETAQFVLTGYELGQWATVPELVASEVDYVLMSDRLVEYGYGLADAEFAQRVRAEGDLVLSLRGRDSDLQLYDVRAWTGAGGTAHSTPDENTGSE